MTPATTTPARDRAERTLSPQPHLGQHGKEVQPFGTLRLVPIALSAKARTESVQLLNGILADTTILYALYKKHHWLVSGPTFYQLHLLFDKHAGEQLELVDLLAERVQSLGGIAVGDPRHAAELTRIPRPPNGAEEVPVMLGRLLEAHDTVAKEMRFALWDTIAGMAFSELVACFIILTTGATLFAAGKHDIGSATEAAEALRPLAGNLSAALLAVGLIGGRPGCPGTHRLRGLRSRRNIRLVVGPRLAPVPGSRVLRGDRGRNGDWSRDQLPWFQPDHGPGVFRGHQRPSSGAARRGPDARLQQPTGNGRSNERQDPERDRLGHRRRDGRSRHRLDRDHHRRPDLAARIRSCGRDLHCEDYPASV